MTRAISVAEKKASLMKGRYFHYLNILKIYPCMQSSDSFISAPRKYQKRRSFQFFFCDRLSNGFEKGLNWMVDFLGQGCIPISICAACDLFTKGFTVNIIPSRNISKDFSQNTLICNTLGEMFLRGQKVLQP